MAFRTDFEQNVELDALLVHAGMLGMLPVAGMGAGLTPDETFGRAEWLKTNPPEYVAKVVARVEEIMDAA